MVADGVVNLAAQVILLRLLVEVEEQVCAGKVLLAHIEDLIAARDAKIRFLLIDLCETFDASLYPCEFGFEMAVREEHKIKIAGARFRSDQRGREGLREPQ